VAKFIGSPAMNILPASIAVAGKQTNVAFADGHKVKLPLSTDKELAGTDAMLGIRPEDLHVAQGAQQMLTGKVMLVESLGEVTLLYVETGAGAEPVIAKLQGTHAFERGQKVSLSADPGKVHLFASNGLSLRR
jgi:alpha-glucoside transport system ATP-binding protein